MQNPSRRLFFGGRTPELSVWEQCLFQLQHKTQGVLWNVDSSHEQAVFTPSMRSDVHYLRQLCHGLGVSLYIWGGPYCIEESFGPVIWVDFAKLNQLELVDSSGDRWFIQAGVNMRQLKEAGFEEVAGLPDEMSVAAWLAEPSYHRYLLSDISHSGLVHASLLQADGSVSSLGAFGVSNTKPLNTVLLQQIIPKLFELANTEMAQALLSQPHWLGRYRLDIFSPNNKQLNLAHLLLGHQGDLGSLEWVVIDKALFKKAPITRDEGAVESTLVVAAQELDAAVKNLFDPHGLFSS